MHHNIAFENLFNSEKQESVPLYVPVVVCLAALFFDLATPRGIAAGVVHIGLVFCARWYRSPRVAFVFAGIGSFLTLIGYFGKEQSHVEVWMVWVNRFLCVGVIWLVAFLLENEQSRQNKLIASRSRSDALLALLMNSDDAIIGKDIDGIIRSWNTGAQRLFGYEAAEIIGKPIFTLVPDELRSEEVRVLDSLHSGEAIDRWDTRRLRKDGSSVHVSITVSPMRDESEEISGAIAIARDISDRRKAEFALEQSEQRYALAIQGMSIGVWEWKLSSGELFLSSRFKDIVGIRSDATDFTFGEIESRLHPDDNERVLSLLHSHLRREAKFDTEFQLRAECGSYLWIHASGQATWDSHGTPIRMVGSIDDISVRKRSEERFRLIVQEAPYALIMANADGAIQLANRKSAEMFGWSRMQMVGRKVESLIPDGLRRHHPQHRANYFNRPANIDPEARIMGRGTELYGLRQDGSEFPVEIGFISFQAGDEELVLCSIVDITERRRVEEQQRRFNEILEQQVNERTAQLQAANNELEQFAFVASHDLKAPLRVIDNTSKWIEEDLEEHLDGETRENMNLLRGRVHRMEKLLDDLLEYSRVGRKRDSSYNETVRGDLLMENILALLCPPLEFQVEVDSSFSSIHIPRMPAQQILYNLINNAIKHHDKPLGRISVKVLDRDADFLFMVQDDGPGIAPRYHAEVFKMFQTLKPRDQVEGSGMGLAVARKHVEVMGGSLTLESEEGRGCIFRFNLPRHLVAEGSAT